MSPPLAFENDALFFHKICILNKLIFRICCIYFNIIQQNACCSILVLHNALNLVQLIINCKTFLFCMSYVQIAINQTQFPHTLRVSSLYRVWVWFMSSAEVEMCVCLCEGGDLQRFSRGDVDTWTLGCTVQSSIK